MITLYFEGLETLSREEYIAFQSGAQETLKLLGIKIKWTSNGLRFNWLGITTEEIHVDKVDDILSNIKPEDCIKDE